MDVGVDDKRCTKCEVVKHKTMFPKRTGSLCKSCVSEYHQARAKDKLKSHIEN